MAFSKSFIVFIAIVAALPSIALAKEFIVGDNSGWTIGFDYQTWAQGKEFHVGDKLVFKYPLGAHNVHKVNATEFQGCVIPTNVAPLESGNDKIVLATPGKKWYVCGVGKHCEVGGQKLAITVLADSEGTTPAPAPMASGSSKFIAATGFQILIAAVVFIVSILMF